MSSTVAIHRFGILISVIWVWALTACTGLVQPEPVPVRDNSAMTDILDQAITQNRQLQQQQAVAPEPPASLENELLAIQPSRPQKRFNISAQQVDAQQFFQDLVSGTGLNIVVDPQITGTITLQLNNVTIDDVLEAIADTYDYDSQKTSYGYKVLANRLMTRIYDLNYLNVARSGSSDTGVSGSQMYSEGQLSSEVTTSYEANFWDTLSSTIQMIIGGKPDRQVVINAQTGVVVVKASPEELRAVEAFIDRAQNSLQRQVIIEARILEVTLSSGYQSGINWNTFANDADRTLTDNLAGTLEGDSLSGVDGLGGIFNINFNVGDFSGLIQLLESQGQVQVLSSPRISTVNNQKAVIKVGSDDFYVTNVDPGGGENNEAPTVELTPFFSGIALDVTPQIGKNNDIILHVRPSVTEVAEKTKNLNIGNQAYQLPLASSSIRESDSIIKARSGQIVVIGGLLQNQSDNSTAGVPILGRMPGLKSLFGQKQYTASKSELVILLQPIITDDQVWQDQLQNSRNNFGP